MKVQTLEKPKLDLSLLNKALFQYNNSSEQPYIICSKETQDLLIEQISPYCYCQEYDPKEFSGGIVAKLDGYKVLEDNTLPLGEFEIR